MELDFSEFGRCPCILVITPPRRSIALVRMPSVCTYVFELHKCVLNTYCVSDITLDSEDKKLNKILSLLSRRLESTGEKDTEQIISTQCGKCQRIPGSVLVVYCMTLLHWPWPTGREVDIWPIFVNQILSPKVLEFGLRGLNQSSQWPELKYGTQDLWESYILSICASKSWESLFAEKNKKTRTWEANKQTKQTINPLTRWLKQQKFIFS